MATTHPVPWPWGEAGTVESWQVRRDEEVSKGQALAMCLVPGLVSQPRQSLLSPASGLLVDVTTGKKGVPGQVMCKIVECAHTTHYAGLCLSCHRNVKHLTKTSQVIVSHSAVTLSQEHAKEQQETLTTQLLSARKLYLVLDLDQTILHATPLPIDESEYEKPEEIHYFTLDNGTQHWHVKFREGLIPWLEEVDKLYEIHIYTNAVRDYAVKIVSILETLLGHTKIFRKGERICTRSDTRDLNKSLDKILAAGDKMALILDDNPNVWSMTPRNVVFIKPYEYFTGRGDPNDPAMLMKNEQLKKEARAAISQAKSDRDDDIVVERNEEGALVARPAFLPSNKRRRDFLAPVAKVARSTNGSPHSQVQAGTLLNTVVESEQEKLEKEFLGSLPSIRKKPLPSQTTTSTTSTTSTTTSTITKTEPKIELTPKSPKSITNSHINNNTTTNTEEMALEKEPTDTTSIVSTTTEAELVTTETTDSTGAKGGTTVQEIEECLEDFKHYKEAKEEKEEKKNEEGATTPKEKIKDTDNYLGSILTVLKDIHRTFYAEYDRTHVLPDIKAHLGRRKKVFRDCYLYFSGVVPESHKNTPQSIWEWKLSKEFGAQCSNDRQPGLSTHLVAVRAGSEKVNVLLKENPEEINTFLVNPNWIRESVFRWQLQDETQYPLYSQSSKPLPVIFGNPRMEEEEEEEEEEDDEDLDSKLAILFGKNGEKKEGEKKEEKEKKDEGSAVEEAEVADFFGSDSALSNEDYAEVEKSEEYGEEESGS